MSAQNDSLGHLTQPRIRSPRAAGIAGILFSLLMIFSMGLIQLTIPFDPSDTDAAWLASGGDNFSLTISLVPIAGVTFLWFMGVARDLLGHLEDQFFSTVFTGSGLLFIGMIFVWAAVGGTILAAYTVDTDLLLTSGFYAFGRTLMRQLFSVYAMAMAGVYVFSTGSIWFRTRAVPRWLVFLTYGVAVSLWLASRLPWWVQLSFPAWVFLVSVYILSVNLRD